MNVPPCETVLCGSHLFGIAAELEPRQRKDWLHSSLLAQMAAFRQFPQRETGWQACYEQVLGHLTWITQGAASTAIRWEPTTRPTLVDLLKRQLPKVLTEPQRVAVDALLERLYLAWQSPFGDAVATQMCLVCCTDEESPGTREAAAEDDARPITTRLAFTVGLILSKDTAFTLQVDADTFQPLGRDWLNVTLDAERLRGEITFGYRFWTLGNYAQYRASVDERLGANADSRIIRCP
jgi:hypothetical protein